MTLTQAQRSTLRFLEFRNPTPSDNPNLRHRIGMLRQMAERGLVHRDLHGHWSLTRQGLAAISHPAKKAPADKDALASASARTVEPTSSGSEGGGE